MALTERTEEDKIEILSSGHIQIRTATIIERDGVEVSRSNHRRVIIPGQDVASESADVKDYAAVSHSPSRIAKFMAKAKVLAG